MVKVIAEKLALSTAKSSIELESDKMLDELANERDARDCVDKLVKLIVRRTGEALDAFNKRART